MVYGMFAQGLVALVAGLFPAVLALVPAGSHTVYLSANQNFDFSLTNGSK